MLRSRFISFVLTTVVVLISLTGCTINSSTGGAGSPVAEAIIEGRFINSNEGGPVAGVEVSVSVSFEGEDSIFGYGTIETMEDGTFQGIINNSLERVITNVYFELEVDGQEYSYSEEVNLEMRYNPPIERISFSYDIGS